METSFQFFHLDSFAFEAFRGNPAGVVILKGQDWPNDTLLQNIAAEVNLPATAFIIPDPQRTKIRWFSPTLEIQLCGHASLAAGSVLLQHLYPNQSSMILSSHYKGDLPIQKVGESIQLDFPRDTVEVLNNIPANIPVDWQVQQAYGGTRLILEVASQQAVQQFPFDRELISSLHQYAVVVTAKSADPHYDFVSRVFEPNLGIDEDPVTGSVHCALADLWSKKLGKNKLRAAQLSQRMGELELEVTQDRVLISGRAELIMKGELKFSSLMDVVE